MESISLNILEIDSYINFIIRCEILNYIFNGDYNSDEIIEYNDKHNIFPFIYKNVLYSDKNVKEYNKKFYKVEINKLNIKIDSFKFFKYINKYHSIYNINNINLFKYRSDIGDGITNAVNKNEIYFAKYDKLNDPFDLLPRISKRFIINDEYIKGIDYEAIKCDYKVFCVTNVCDNILMWSHYGNSHKGVCSNYKHYDIIDSINSNKSIDICFYGNVVYKRRRPALTFNKYYTMFLTNDLINYIFVIKSLFVKYYKWEYEEEFRYVISGSTDTTICKANEYILGYNYKSNSLYNIINAKKCSIDKNSDDYKLIIK